MAKVLRFLISVDKLMTAKIQAAKVAKNERTPFFKVAVPQLSHLLQAIWSC